MAGQTLFWFDRTVPRRPMNVIDIGVIAIYFLLVIAVGFWYQARAARGLAARP